MAFDFKKEYKEYYLPPKTPELITVPPMNYAAVRGVGDPNHTGGDYQRAIGLLYGVSFTLKMCEKAGHSIEGYFPYVVPPLEGLWWQEGTEELDLTKKGDFRWISMIRLPDFVTEEELRWATEEAARKKKTDFSPVLFFPYDEGLCVQCMHVGPYEKEPETIEAMKRYARENGCQADLGVRRHHEIYLGDPRRTAPERLRTVIRHPVRRKENIK